MTNKGKVLYPVKEMPNDFLYLMAFGFIKAYDLTLPDAAHQGAPEKLVGRKLLSFWLGF